MTKTIALVEDEQAIADNYRALLQRHGYRVAHYSDRHKALDGFAQSLPDLAIIDVGLGADIEGGFELCRVLRVKAPTLPIIFLTARDSEFDIVSGLRIGADDYLSKDISLPHLMARIVALLRRVDALAEGDKADAELINRDQLVLDMERIRATWAKQMLDLTVTEFWIVHALAYRPGHVKTRQQLMDAANVVLDDHTVTSHIKRIRRKFESIDADFSAIETVYGLGYRWLSGD